MMLRRRFRWEMSLEDDAKDRYMYTIHPPSHEEKIHAFVQYSTLQYISIHHQFRYS